MLCCNSAQAGSLDAGCEARCGCCGYAATPVIGTIRVATIRTNDLWYPKQVTGAMKFPPCLSSSSEDILTTSAQGLSFAAAPSKRSPQYLTGLQERAQSQQVTRLLTRTVSRARADSGFRFVALMRHSEQFVSQTCSVDDSLNGGGYRLINPMSPKSTFDRECWATRPRVDRKATDSTILTDSRPHTGIAQPLHGSISFAQAEAMRDSAQRIKVSLCAFA